MSSAKGETKTRTMSLPRRAARPSGRNSTETSPLRAYLSPFKDFSTYTPVRQSREHSSTLRSRLNTSTETRKKPTTQTTALDSMNDLKTKTSKLDEESKKLADKVGQIRLKLQAKRGKNREESKELARVIVRVVTVYRREIGASVWTQIKAKAEEVRALQRQANRYFVNRCLRRYFGTWKAEFKVMAKETDMRLDAAENQFRRNTLGKFVKIWRNCQRRSELMTPTNLRIPNPMKPATELEHPRPASLSPKPIQPDSRPFSSSNTRKIPIKSPVPSPKPKSTPLSVPVSHPRTKKPLSKENQFFAPVSQELLSVAAKHHSLSLLVTSTQYYQVWKPLVDNARNVSEAGRKHYRKQLGQRVFHAWLEFYVTSYQSHGDLVSQDSMDSDSQYEVIVRSFRVVRGT